jgi:hypothetical protein
VKLPRANPRKLAIGAAVTLVILALLYGVGVNVLLSTGGLASLVSRHPERLRLQYAHASTAWPGKFHVEGLDLRGRNAHVEWELHVDTCDVDVSLLGLLRRRLHVGKMVGDGAVVRTRVRLDPAEVTPERVALLPPIDGFAAVPRADDPVLEKKEPWHIELEGADATHVREVWIDTIRLVGDLHVTGGFALFRKRFAIPRAALTVREGAVTTGGDAIVTGVEGGADVTIDSVDLGETKGAAVVRSMSSHSALRGRAGDLAFLRRFTDDADVTFTGGAGEFRGELFVDHGIVKKGSGAHVDLEPLRVAVAERAFATRMRADVTTGEDDAGGWANVDVVLSALAFFEPGAKEPALTSDAISASARVAETDMARLPRDLTYTWDAPRIQLADLHAIDDYLPKGGPFHVDGGKATLGTRGRGSTKALAGDADIDGRVAIQLEGARIASPVASKAHVRADLAAGTIDLSGSTVDLASPSVSGGSAYGGWWGKAKAEATEIKVSPLSVRTTLTTACRDGAPLLAFYAAMRGVPPAVRTALHIVPDALVESMTADAHGVAHLSHAKGIFEVRGLDLRGASSRLRGEVRRRGESKEGALLIEAGPASAAVAFEGQKTDVVVVDAVRWFEARPPLPPAR